MAIYEIETENGTYQIETDEGQNPSADAQKQKGLMGRMMDKAASISPELVNPVNMIPGVALARMGNAALEKSQEGYDMMGNLAAEKIDNGGKHPLLSAAVGTGVQMVPDLVGAAQGLRELPALAKGAQSAGSMVKDGVKALKAPSKAKVLEQTAESIQQELDALALKAKSFPNEFNQTRIKALTEKANAGKALQAWESKIDGYKFGGQPEITDSTKALIKKIPEMKPERLAQKYDLKQLQEFYDKAKGMGNTGLDSPLVTRAKQTITEAQDILRPGIKELREGFGTSAKNVEGLKEQFKTGKASLAEMTKRKQIAMADVKKRLSKATTGKKFLKKVAWRAAEIGGLSGALSLLK